MIREAIKAGLARKNMKPAHLADAIGLDRGSIYGYLSGKTSLGHDKIEKAFETLDIELRAKEKVTSGDIEERIKALERQVFDKKKIGA